MLARVAVGGSLGGSLMTRAESALCRSKRDFSGSICKNHASPAPFHCGLKNTPRSINDLPDCLSSHPAVLGRGLRGALGRRLIRDFGLEYVINY